MGVVIRQSIFTSIMAYAGVVIGYINLLYLYPAYLTTEQIGLLRTILDAALLFAPFAQAGLAQSITRFYPHFNSTGRQASSFVTTMLLFSFFAFLIFSVLLFSFKDAVLSLFGNKAEVLSPYLHVVLWLTASFMFMAVIEAYSRSLLKVAFPNFVREVFTRLLQALLVFFYFLEFISFHQLITGHIFIYAGAAAILLLSLILPGHFTLRFDKTVIQSAHLPEIFRFSSLSFISSGSMALIGKIDSLMVAGMTGFTANAIYTTSFYIATVIEIPKRAMSQTVMPLIAQAFKDHNLHEIERLYKSVSINLFIVGALLLIGISVNLHNVYALMPKGETFEQGFYVVFLIGLGKLIDMLFGPSSEIIVLSRYYAFNIILLMTLALVVILLNLILIPAYGITGAAIGSCAAMLIFNAVKYFFIWYKFRIQPFGLATLKVFSISLLTLFVNYLTPEMDAVILDMMLRSFLITLVFGSLIILTKCSEDMNRMLNRIISQLKGN
ncbi:MAG: oligosaccharide flippase family protein [Cyclobacteriaceae bacterium]|nr:oligosaccharide flippase family protein [Cyclobacteriaceae bacterium]